MGLHPIQNHQETSFVITILRFREWDMTLASRLGLIPTLCLREWDMTLASRLGLIPTR